LEGYGKNGDLKVPFWSTKDAGQKPFTFQIGMGNVIKGWDEGVAGMDLGETARVRSLLDVLISGLFQTHFQLTTTTLSPIAIW
jgi:FKBP-type peptidyl-prolyl cis-trans isomerase